MPIGFEILLFVFKISRRPDLFTSMRVSEATESLDEDVDAVLVAGLGRAVAVRGHPDPFSVAVWSGKGSPAGRPAFHSVSLTSESEALAERFGLATDAHLLACTLNTQICKLKSHEKH